MKFEFKPVVVVALLIGVLILFIMLIRGCQQGKKATTAYSQLTASNDSLKSALSNYRSHSDSSAKLFQDSLDLERGQRALIEAQKGKTEKELDNALSQNRELLKRHKMAQYVDTTDTLVPHGFIVECEDCFSKLETTTNLSLKYKSDFNKLQDKWQREDTMYKRRFNEIEIERMGFNNKISALTKENKKRTDALEPHGRLYLSWGVLWSPFPVAAGAGLMYQNKRNLIWGANVYYGKYGTTVETNIHFPLSLRFK